jgi:hypothetical protein
MAKCPQLRRMGFLIGVTVRREKALDISGCNSTAFQYAPGSCSAGPAIKCWLLATVALRHNRNVNEAIARALTIFRESPELDDEGAFRALIDRGVERSIAARIVEFLPIAYCRVLLLNSGVQFSNSFVRAASPLKIQSLSSEPLWIFFLASAESELRGGTARREMLMVAGRSAEFQAINQMLDKGAELKNVALPTISLLWPESGPESDT